MKNKNKLICLITLSLTLFLNPLHAKAQTGKITGHITEQETGETLPGVNLLLEGTTLGTTTDPKGNFTLDHIPAGSYKLIASFIGYATQQKTIDLKANQTVTINFALPQTSIELQTVEIVGRREISYKNNVSFSGTKTASNLKDVPQAVNYVTKELMQDQLATRTGDLVKNISGVNQFSGYEDVTVRGFRAGGSRLLNGLKWSDGWNQPVMWNIERYEVIKGPASALYGSADPGGTINLVTKKPLDIGRQSVSFTTGSYNTYRSTLDFTGPLTEDKSLLYRLNVGYEDAASFRDLQLNKSFMIAPSVSFLPDEKTQVNVDFVYSKVKGKLDRGQPIFGGSAGTDIYSVPITFGIGKPNDFLEETNLYFTASLNHQFTEAFSFNASYLRFKYTEELVEHRTDNSYAHDGDGNEIPTLMRIRAGYRFNQSTTDGLTAYTVSKFELGGSKHQALLGIDYNQEISPKGTSASSNARGYRNVSDTGAINNYNPANRDAYLLDNNGNPVPNIPHFDLINPDYSLGDLNSYHLTYTFGAPSKYYAVGGYFQDQFSWGPLKALIGLRGEHHANIVNYKEATQESVTQFAFIPRAGLVWSLSPAINLYATYGQGFQPQGVAQIQDPARYGGPFDPLTSRAFEIGAKADWFDQRLSATTALYRITQNNILVSANDPNNPDLLRQRGQEMGRGIELDMQGKITPAFSLSGNLSLSKTKVTQDSDPTLIGREKENAPNIQGGVWGRYNFLNGALQGIGVGGGVNFVGKRNTFDDPLKLPAYQIFDAALYYSVNKVQISAKLNNVFNTTHWSGGYNYVRLFPGTPRHYYTSVAYTF